jgi:hypothetical protein
MRCRLDEPEYIRLNLVRKNIGIVTLQPPTQSVIKQIMYRKAGNRKFFIFDASGLVEEEGQVVTASGLYRIAKRIRLCAMVPFSNRVINVFATLEIVNKDEIAKALAESSGCVCLQCVFIWDD